MGGWLSSRLTKGHPSLSDQSREKNGPEKSGQQATRTQPSYHAFQVDEGKDGKGHFTRIGAAFPHKDGQGHNIDLKAMPVNGRITLRTPMERLEKQREGETATHSKDEGRSQ